MKAWFPIIVPALVVLAQQSVSYALVGYECAQQQRFPIHAVAALALTVALVGVLVGWRDWKAAGVAASEENAAIGANARFLAIVGTSMSALMALVVLAMWLTAAFIPPCVR